MKISRHNARQIVSEINQIIDPPINIMDNKGYIIASTDDKRLDTYHGAAKRILNEKLKELIIREDDIYTGTKKGVNLPIMFEGEIVGVVGITGDYEEVGRFGYIIKKMTEILLLDIYNREQLRMKEDIKARFVEDWIFGNSDNIDHSFAVRGQELGILTGQQWMVLVIYAGELYDNDDSWEKQNKGAALESIIKENLSKEDNLYIRSGKKYISLIVQQNHKKIKMIVEDIQSEAKKSLGLRLAFGVCGTTVGANKVYEAFVKADKAAYSSAEIGYEGLRFYEDLDLDIFIGEISSESKREFINKVFYGYSEQEVKEWAHLIEIFIECNGSIGLTAEKLFIHKNTLQYRIKKLKDQTGYDPRKTEHAALFHMAVKFINSDNM